MRFASCRSSIENVLNDEEVLREGVDRIVGDYLDNVKEAHPL